MSRITPKIDGKRTPPAWIWISYLLLFILSVPAFYFSRNSTQFLVTGLLGLMALIIALWRSFIAEQQAGAAQRQAETAKQGQVTDRFRWAIDQISDKDHLYARLGGIYALRQVAKEEPSLRETVTEVLCCYVRQLGTKFVKEHQVEDGLRMALANDYMAGNPLPTLPEEIQAVISVFGECGPPRDGLDLSWMHLTNAKLRGDFRGANLIGANLIGADLRGTDLREVKIQEADLIGADLRGADLRKADLREADLDGTRLGGADFRGADLRRAKHLTLKDLSSACGDETTKLPKKGPDLPATWPCEPEKKDNGKKG